jgi:hypothetical protein
VASVRNTQAVEERIRMLRKIARTLAQRPGTPPAFLASVHELLLEAEAERGRINGKPSR